MKRRQRRNPDHTVLYLGGAALAGYLIWRWQRPEPLKVDVSFSPHKAATTTTPGKVTVLHPPGLTS